jgi:hypothetical protein
MSKGFSKTIRKGEDSTQYEIRRSNACEGILLGVISYPARSKRAYH